MKINMRVPLAVLGSLLLLALMLWLMPAAPVEAQYSVPCYSLMGGAKWVAGSGCEWEMQSGSTLDLQAGTTVNGAAEIATTGQITGSQVNATGDLYAADDVTAQDDVTSIDDVIVGGEVRLARQAQTVTMNGWITPTGSYMYLSAGGTVGTSRILSGTTQGQLLYMEMSSNQTLTISDTGWLKLSGNIALGQYDTLTLMWDGSYWIQYATSNN